MPAVPTITQRLRARSASRRARRWLYAGAVAVACTLVVAGLLIAAIGPQRVHEALGDSLYNGLVGWCSVLGAAAVLLTAVVLDLLLMAGLRVVRLLSDPPSTARTAILATLLALALGCGVLVVHAQRTCADPLLDRPWTWLFDEATLYAPGYSEAGFMAIRPGMAHDEVQALIGEPLYATMTPLGYFTCYSRGGASMYRERIVIFDHRLGHVVETRAEVFLD